MARSASQCRAEQLLLPLISLEPGIRALAGPAVLLLAQLLPNVSALLPSTPGSTFTTAAVAISPSGRGVVEVDAVPFPGLEAVPDCKTETKNPKQVCQIPFSLDLAVMLPHISSLYFLNKEKKLIDPLRGDHNQYCS